MLALTGLQACMQQQRASEGNIGTAAIAPALKSRHWERGYLISQDM